LGGLAPDAAATASTIVQRDASGDFAANVITAAEFSGPATKLVSGRGNWVGTDVLKNVVGNIAWQAYGNNRTIFDASMGLDTEGNVLPSTFIGDFDMGNQIPMNQYGLDGSNPSGTGNTQDGSSATGTGAGAANLMASNGTNTFGVRVNFADRSTRCMQVNGFNEGVTKDHVAKFVYPGTGNPKFTIGLATVLGISAGADLDVKGNIVASLDVTAYSDRTLKKNIVSIPNALDKVCAIGGYTFDRTDIVRDRQTGVIAQEVLEVLPEAVHQDEDGIYSVAYGNMVGLLVEAIKELREEVAELRGNV
jgi:hypothetical protein